MIGMTDMTVNPQTVRKQISSGIDIVIYCTRFPNGKRKVASVSEIMGAKDGSGEIEIHEIYRYERFNVDQPGDISGRFVPTGYIPSFIRENPDLNKSDKVHAPFQGEKEGS